MENLETTENNLIIDEFGKFQLYEAAKWAKFLGIIGLIFTGLIVLGTLFFTTFMSTIQEKMQTQGGNNPMSTGVFVIIIIVYLAIAVLYYFLSIYLYRFGNKMKMAIKNLDQDVLNTSLLNLKKHYSLVGILTAVFLGLYALFMVIVIVFAVVASS